MGNYIKENLEWLSRAQTIARMGIWDQNPVEDTLWWSDETYRIFGLAPQSKQMDFEKFLLIVHPQDREMIREKTLRALSSDDFPYHVNYRIVLNGNLVKFLHEEALIERNTEGKPIRIIGIIRDITREKQSEAKIKASLFEKETLLKEIHHRVKNNLNVISSLLALQARSINDDHVRLVLRDSQNRIYAMSVVHESLYGSDSLSQIKLGPYLEKIAHSIKQSYSDHSQNICVSVESEDIVISIEQASPLGLILNELITNSLKYAFPDQREGKITVQIKKRNKELELAFADDGIGLPDDFNWKNGDSLGLSLIQSLAENQLDGKVDLQNENGVKTLIRFNLD